ncbi:ERAP1-like C-terminal domain-containing protein, partial [Streptomyces palmae]
VAPAPEDVPDTAAAGLNFDGISYAKGASALRQLVAWLGERDFLTGINDHFARHRFGNATLADFIDSLAQASGRDVHTWADHWLRTTGVDTLTPEIRTEGDRWTATVHHQGSRPHRLAIGLYDRSADQPHRLDLRERLEIDISGKPGEVVRFDRPGRRPDLLLLNDGDLAYTKIRLDPDSWETATLALSWLPDPLSRAVLWSAARDMVRDGALAPTAFLQAARAHLPQEPDTALVEGVLAFARLQIADRYLPADRRPTALATLTDTCRELLRHTQDGSGPSRRLAAVRTLIDSTTDTGELRGWLTEGTVPGGPELDPELRWRTLHRLAVLGAATPDEIDAELAGDSGATGRQGAARCRAARPDPAAKRAAWSALFDSDDLSAHLFNATFEGFWQSEQHTLLADYVPEYFPAAVALARRRGATIARAVARTGFPAVALADTVRLAEECLTRTDLPPALRRQLADELDDARRALRVRQTA